MKRKRILTQLMLYFLMSMLLLAVGCSSSDDDNDTPDPNQQELMVTISGTITTAGGVPVQGVVMSALIDVAIMNIDVWEGSFATDTFSFIRTDENGQYSLRVPAALLENYTLVLTPSKTGYTFAPTSRGITVGLVDIPNQNFTATAVNAFSQADLTGTWRINMLRTGAENMWMRARITIAPTTGVATCLSMSDSNGTVACPTGFDLGFTMDEDGVITQQGSNAVTDGGHMTMNTGKDFVAGTGTNGTSSYQLMIAQKEPTILTGYAPTDVQGRNITYHSLSVGNVLVGATNEWRYGTGTTAASTSLLPLPGTVTVSANSEFDPAGAVAVPTMNGVTLAVDANGVVTDTSGILPDFEGFLSADERTIVGTYSGRVTGEYGLIVFQILTAGQATTMTGGSFNHILASAAGGAAANSIFWAYHDINISRLETTFLPTLLALTFDVDIMLSLGWEFSDNLGLTVAQKLLFTDLEKININNNGVVTINTGLGTTASPIVLVFHGQLANDGTFMVGVETMTLSGTDFYALEVITH